jgi:acyl carrier protein
MARATAARSAAMGVRPMSPALALHALEALLVSPRVSAAVVSFDWTQLPLLYGPGGDLPLFDAGAWPRPAPAVERAPLVYEVVERAVLEAVARQLAELGLDSLQALRLRNWVQAEYDVRLPITFLLQSPSMAEVAKRIMTLCAADTDSTPPPAPVRAVGAMGPESSRSREEAPANNPSM